MRFGTKKQRGELIRLSVTLFLITAVVAVSLAVVNYFTEPVIAEKSEERISDALSSLFQEADRFELVKTTTDSVMVSNELVPINAVYAVKLADNTTIGYCIRVAPTGYSDTIDMLVGCDRADVVTGVRILEISDTPGVGSKVNTDEEFQKSLVGINNQVTAVLTEPSSKREVQVIAGATVSSKAYIRGINAAIEVAQGLE